MEPTSKGQKGRGRGRGWGIERVEGREGEGREGREEKRGEEKGRRDRKGREGREGNGSPWFPPPNTADSFRRLSSASAHPHFTGGRNRNRITLTVMYLLMCVERSIHSAGASLNGWMTPPLPRTTAISFPQFSDDLFRCHSAVSLSAPLSNPFSRDPSFTPSYMTFYYQSNGALSPPDGALLLRAPSPPWSGIRGGLCRLVLCVPHHCRIL